MTSRHAAAEACEGASIPNRPAARGRQHRRARLLSAAAALGLAATALGPTGAQAAPVAAVTVALGSTPAAAPPVGAKAAGVAKAPAAPAAAPSVSARPSASVARQGSVVRVSGTMRGAPAGSSVALQRLQGRTWRTVATSKTSTARATAGRYTVRVPATKAGRSTYRVASVPKGSQRVGTSNRFTVSFGRGNPRSVGYLTKPPARWNPCAPIRYRVNLEGAPRGAGADVDKAVGQIAAGSGLRFVKVGNTTVVPGSQGRDVLDDYPADTQLVVAFARPADPREARRSAYLSKGSDVVAVGGAFYELDPIRAGDTSWHRIAQGYVVLDRTKKLPSGFGSGNRTGLLGTWGQVLMHELGHVVGLDHPKLSDPAQIMYPSTTSKPSVWGAGDLVGLQRLGSASGCLGTSTGSTAAAAQQAGFALPVQRVGH